MAFSLSLTQFPLPLTTKHIKPTVNPIPNFTPNIKNNNHRYTVVCHAAEEKQQSETKQQQQQPSDEELSELGAEIKKAMMDNNNNNNNNNKDEGILGGVVEEVGRIEWPAFNKVLGTTGVVLGVIAGSSVVLLTVNAVLAELSDRVFAGRGVQDFFG